MPGRGGGGVTEWKDVRDFLPLLQRHPEISSATFLVVVAFVWVCESPENSRSTP